MLQGAHDTIDSLQTQVLDLEIKLGQAKASLADMQHASPSQDAAKLQEQVRQSELKAAAQAKEEHRAALQVRCGYVVSLQQSPPLLQLPQYQFWLNLHYCTIY